MCIFCEQRDDVYLSCVYTLLYSVHVADHICITESLGSSFTL